MSSYLKKEISEWNTADLSSWLIDNKYPGISELCQNNSLSGYDLFFINDDILKNELGLSSFHERKVTMKLINKLINEHLKLNIINSNGDNVIITLDNNQNTSLGELSEYIGGMFNINPKDILYKDNSKTEVLSPTLKIVRLLVLYPRLYKTLNVFNMKDYHQPSENNENLESKSNDYNNNLNMYNSVGDGAISENESEFQKSNITNNMNMKMNYDYILNKTNENIKKLKNEITEQYDNDEMNENNKNMYNEEQKINNKIIYNNDYDIKGAQRVNANEKHQNIRNENIDENENNWNIESNDLDYRIGENLRENNNMNKGFNNIRNRKNMNLNDNPYSNAPYNIMENRDNNYYNNILN